MQALLQNFIHDLTHWRSAPGPVAILLVLVSGFMLVREQKKPSYINGQITDKGRQRQRVREYVARRRTEEEQWRRQEEEDKKRLEEEKTRRLAEETRRLAEETRRLAEEPAKRRAAFHGDVYLLGLLDNLDVVLADLREALIYTKNPHRSGSSTEWSNYVRLTYEMMENRLRLRRSGQEYIDAFYGRKPGDPEWQRWILIRQAWVNLFDDDRRSLMKEFTSYRVTEESVVEDMARE